MARGNVAFYYRIQINMTVEFDRAVVICILERCSCRRFECKCINVKVPGYCDYNLKRRSFPQGYSSVDFII